MALSATGVAVAARDTYILTGGILATQHHDHTHGSRNGDDAAMSARSEDPGPHATTAARAGRNPAFATQRRLATQQLDRAQAGQRADRHQREAPEWVLPVRGYHLSARFGQNGDKWASFHHGLDFAAPEGTPVHAVGAGRIIAATRGDSAYGNFIKIEHNDGTATLYAHMSAFERTSGEVDAGTVIGYVGMTGNATGPHLHLEVRPDNGDLKASIDPFPWLKAKGLYP